MSRVGLFGGTFNPVHLGHLRAAEEVREQRRLDRVDFVLAATPPHKMDEPIAATADRQRMLELAIAEHPAFRVNACEVERGGRSYSVDTIRDSRAREPDAAFTFIIGADAFAEIESWKDFASIFELCDVCVMSRPGTPATDLPIAVAEAFCYDSARGEYRHRSGFSLTFLPITALMISASDVRQRLATHRSIRYLVPTAVADYITRHGMYGAGAPQR